MNLWFETSRMMFDCRIIETDGLLVFNNWYYETQEAAEEALKNKLPGEEPEGWFRHFESGRRRPDGDPEQEYINW
jgi:hypothetical protein